VIGRQLKIVGLILGIILGIAALPVGFLVAIHYRLDPSYHGGRLSYWINAQKDSDPQIRQLAANAMSEALASDDPPIRIRAAKGLHAPLPKEMLPVAVGAAKSEDGFVSNAAIMALGATGRQARDVIPELLEIMRSRKETGRDRTNVIDAIGRIAPPNNIDVLAALKEAANDQDKDVRQAAREAISGLKQGDVVMKEPK
jgi:HEAT repeat protein